MYSHQSFIKTNIKFLILISIIIILSYIHLFLGKNLFNFYELDIHVMYDYLSRSNLSGWRLDKIIGTNMLIGDPSFHSWSILSLIFSIPFIDKIFLYNITFIAINIYAAFSLFYLICFVNPKLSKINASIISSLIFLSILRFEFNYIFSWALVFPTIILSAIILFKFFKNNKNKYIFSLFLVYFIGFNFGSIFAIQQSLLFSFLFFIFYSLFFKEKVFKNYLKIIFVSLFLLILSSSWILYPYLYEIITSTENLERTANYKKYDLFEVNLSLFKLFFNTLFGSFINSGDINLPDRDLIPSFDWINTLSVFFNLILIQFLIFDKNKNFWVYFSKYIILFYLIHIFLSEISPVYYSLNLFILDTMTWSKVNIEIYVFQLILISFFITGNYQFSKNKFVKIYSWLLFFYLIFLILFSIDIILNFNLTKNLFTHLIILFSFTDLYFFENTNSLNLFIDDIFERFSFFINVKFILIQLSSLILLIFVYFNFSYKKKKFFNLAFLIVIFFNNYISISYFTPIEHNNFNLWGKIEKEQIIKSTDRLISLSQNYLFNMKPQKIDIKNLNEKNIKSWIERNPIKKKDKYYGIMSPPFLSFSSNASFINKNLINDNRSLFELVPDKIKNDFTANNSFEILQEGIYDYNFINNLSISHAYSVFDLDQVGIDTKNLDLIWKDENLFIYKISDALPYFYIPSKFSKISKKFYKEKITPMNAFFFDNDYLKIKDLKTGKADFTYKIKDNSYFELEYDSKYENVIVISNKFDSKWKINSDKNLETIKVNYYFTGIIMQPGKYKIQVYFDNSSYRFGIYLSIAVVLIISLTYKFNFFNLRK